MANTEFKITFQGEEKIIKIYINPNYSDCENYEEIVMTEIFPLEKRALKNFLKRDFRLKFDRNSHFVRFFEYKPRDKKIYGGSTKDGQNVEINEVQLFNILCKMSLDILQTLDRIIEKHGSQTYYYALWYKNKMKNDEYPEYEQFITLACCHNIIATKFMKECGKFKLVEFKDASQKVRSIM